MNREKMGLVVLALLVASIMTFGQGKQGLGKQCPDKSASIVAAKEEEVGAQLKCVKKPIPVIGNDGGTEQWIPTCGQFLILTPEHGVCRGQVSEGNRCVPDGELPVQKGQCHCIPVQIIGQWAVAGCKCGPFQIFGTVENFTTVTCS
jgi:hypothetical protein